MVERRFRKPQVSGSIPEGGSIFSTTYMSVDVGDGRFGSNQIFRFSSNPMEERVHLGGGFFLGLLVDVLVNVLSEADV